MLVLAVIAAAVAGTKESAPLAPQLVLQNYQAALASVAHPPTVSFEYSVEQLGLRNMEQTHRVYRRGLAERDETLVVDGYHLKAPSVRIIASRTNRYEIDRIAPKLSDYDFRFVGAVNENNAYGYVFQTQSRATTPYAITEVEVDGRSFLPRTIHFRIAGDGARGSGVLNYDLVDKYWVVQSAEVSAHLSSGAIAHESLRWDDYHFPKSLPDETFEAPLPDATATPAADAPAL
jgi:hypothetical protein